MQIKGNNIQQARLTIDEENWQKWLADEDEEDGDSEDATPYFKMNGVDGPKEISVSAGFGIPIMNAYNNRSIEGVLRE